MLKNTLFLTATFGLALFAPACGGDKDSDTSDTATTTGTNPTGDDDDDDGTTYIFEAAVDCPNDTNGDPIEMYVRASVDNGSRALIDMADTSNNSNWYETHTLLPVSSGGGITEFEATATSNAGGYTDGVDSLFQCIPGQHISEGFNVMTYVVRAYDGGGALWDCFAQGNDAAGMVAGNYEDRGNTIDYGDVSGCTVVRSAN